MSGPTTPRHGEVHSQLRRPSELRHEVRRLLARARERGLSSSDARFIELCDARDRVDTKLLKVRRWHEGLSAARTELERARSGLAAAVGRLRERLDQHAQGSRR